MVFLSFAGVFKFFLYLIYWGACLSVCGLVLVRQGETGGLSSAFGGPGDTFLGARAAKTIDKIIIWGAVIYISLSIIVNLKTVQGW